LPTAREVINLTSLVFPTTPIKIPKKKAKYIAIEGIDGSGKTLISQLLSDSLKIRSFEVLQVREPYTKEIKKLLTENPNINPIVEAYLFATDRLILHSKIIAQELGKKDYIITDRSYIASLTYQVVRGAPEEIVYSINMFAIKPDIVYLLDVPVEVALKRLNEKKKKQLVHLEDEGMLDKLRERYLELAQTEEFRNKIIRIDATQAPSEVVKEIIRDLELRKMV